MAIIFGKRSQVPGSAFRVRELGQTGLGASHMKLIQNIQPDLKGCQRERVSFGTGFAAYHLMRALPQVRPPPKTGRQTRSFCLMLPSLTASSRAMAQEAEEMLPYLLRVT